MKLDKGLNRDMNPVTQPEGTWRDANNVLLDLNNNAIKSEYTTQFIASIPYNNAQVIGVINTPTESVFFIIHTIDKKAIVKFDGSNFIEVINSETLPFNPLVPISGEYFYNYKQELVIQWYSSNDVPRILNVDTIGFELSNNNDFILPNDLDYLEQFPNFQPPDIKLVNVSDTGGSLRSGVYYISISYKLVDDSYGEFMPLSNPIFINKFNKSDSWFNVFGGKGGEQTSKSVLLSVTKLDPRYPRYRIATVYKSDGVVKAYIGPDYNTLSSDLVGITSLSNFAETDIANVIVPNVNLKRIGASTVINNRLYPANVQIEDRIRYQKYANNIRVNWVYGDPVSLLDYNNSHKDELVLFDRKSFMPDEIYAFYIRFVKKNGEAFTDAFHIPGREPTAADIAFSNNVEVQKVYPSAKKFHMENTSGAVTSPNTTNLMGYWENENEFYPTNDEYNGTIDYDDNIISNGVDLSNGTTRVRHHKFPSIYSMQMAGHKPFYTDEVLPTGGIVRWGEPLNHTIPALFQTTTADFGSFGSEIGELTTVWSSGINKDVRMVSELSATYDGKFLPEGGQAYIQIKIDRRFKNDQGDVTQWSVIEQATKTCNYGEKVTCALSFSKLLSTYEDTQIRVIMTGFPTVGLGDIDTQGMVYSGQLRMFEDKDHTSDQRAYGGIFGIKVENIDIPDYISQQCSHFEILYGRRDGNNMSIISQGIVRDYLSDRYTPLPDETTRHDGWQKFFPFDILATRSNFSISHMKLMYGQDRRVISKAATSTNMLSIGIEAEFYAVKSTRHVLNDVAYSMPSSLNSEEHIGVRYDESDPVEVPERYLKPPYLILTNSSGDARDGAVVCAAGSFKTDVYTPFTNQPLVRTGKLFPIPVDDKKTTIIVGKLHGGDVVYNCHGISAMWSNDGVDGEVSLAEHYMAPVYSVNNIGYRYLLEDDPVQYFYPKKNFAADIEGSQEPNINDDDLGGVGLNADHQIWKYMDAALGAGSHYWWQVPETYSYSKDWTSINDVLPVRIFNVEDDFTSTFPYRIYRSTIQGSESTFQSWRVIKVNEYYDNVYNKGEIKALDTDGVSLLIQHEFSTFIAKRLSELKFANGIISALGDSDIFDTTPVELLSTESGYVGCNSKFASVRTKIGNIIVDGSKGRIFIFGQSGIQEISMRGLKKWFIPNLKLKGSDTNLDNPFINRGISVSYDEIYDRVLISKADIDPLNSDNDYSWVLSYYPSIGAWVSFHDYTGSFMFSNRTGVFVIKNYTNAPADIKQINTSGQGSSIHIDVVFNEPKIINKHFLSVMWNTIVKGIGGEVKYDVTFNKAIIYNYNRHSDLITLTNYSFPDTGNIRNTGGVWKLNEFRDKLKEDNKGVIELMDADSIRELQVTTLSPSELETDWTSFNMFQDDFVVVRFIRDAKDGDSIEINTIDVNSKPMQR